EGGLWVVTDYEDPNMPGGSFIGHGITGWDPYEEKYVGVWIDNQTANLGLMEGTWDEETQTLTMTAEGRDPMTGEVSTATSVMVFESADKRRHSMKGPGPGGEEMEYFSIEYVRKEK
ncbi:MAG: DUF1579 family protein, partial [Planctomycetota bacterium]|nr:DUF1579 family protein [Planctomycetota bacterium]